MQISEGTVGVHTDKVKSLLPPCPAVWCCKSVIPARGIFSLTAEAHVHSAAHLCFLHLMYSMNRLNRHLTQYEQTFYC